MKLRIKGNSLRLRLLRGEVEQLGKTGRVAESIRFGASPDGQLIYVLEIDCNAELITTCFADNRITVRIPELTARNWIETDKITLMCEQPIENAKQDEQVANGTAENVLKILIEKDFVCLDRKDDPDNSDAFPHPSGKCA